MSKLGKEHEKRDINKLTIEDFINIQKWITAASMMIEGGIRTKWSPSEQSTFRKLDQLKQKAEKK